MSSIRQNKVSRLLQKELGLIFQQDTKSMFNGAFITVTTVRISPDLSYAKVYLSIFASDAEEIIALVKDRKDHIRKSIGNKVRHQLRIVPDFAFFIDDSLEYAERIDELLK